MELKPHWTSKTLLFNCILGALAYFHPSTAEYISQNPTITFPVFAGINMLLRLITKSKLQLW